MNLIHGTMTRIYDITGMRFGKLTAVKKVEAARRSRWLFRCDCGGECVGMAQSAKCGDLKNCPVCRSAERSKGQTRHGDCKTRLHNTWIGMRGRCNTPSLPHYHRYGGRGISVCPEWDDFAAFKAWALANGYKPNLTIERIDNDGDYEPSNCAWVTLAEQAQNKRQTRWLEYQGQTLNLMQLSKLVGIDWHTLRGRLDAGLTVDEAVNHKRRGYLPTRKRVRA